MRRINVTEDQFIDCVKVAYNYGIQQTSNRVESKETIFAWVGYLQLPIHSGNSIYAAYKHGRHVKQKTNKSFKRDVAKEPPHLLTQR